MNLFLPLLLGGLTILIPLAAIVWLLGSRIDSLRLFILRSLLSGGIVAFACSAGAWSYSSWYLRIVIFSLFIATLLYRLYTVRALPWSIDRRRSAVRMAGRGAALLCVALLNLQQIDGRFFGGDAIDLRFPLEGGRYCVLQGGRGPLANPFHYLYGASRYALDIVRLNEMGNRASGVAPARVEEYAIFGDTVVAPCDCTVIRAVDLYPDQPPGEADSHHAAGNHIVLQCGELELLLAHLRRGSVRVSAGRDVHAGEPLAAVGNSGNSSEPHLHIQATRFERRQNSIEAIPVPITFGGRFLAINDVVASSVEAGR
jgi:hypothetical protein